MEYTLVERDELNLIKITSEDQETSMILSRSELQKALILLSAVDGQTFQPQTISAVVQNTGLAVPVSMTTSEAYDPIPRIVHQPQQINRPQVTKKPSTQVDLNKVKKFLAKIQGEQKKYEDEQDIDEKERGNGFSETAIVRAIQSLYPSIDRNTMFIALNKSAIGMDKDLFDITFQRATQQGRENDVYDDE